VTFIRLEQLRGNVRTDGARKQRHTDIHRAAQNNTQNAEQKHIKSSVLKQMIFNVNDENWITLEYFTSRINAV
jgi:hypothetical protein